MAFLAKDTVGYTTNLGLQAEGEHMECLLHMFAFPPHAVQRNLFIYLPQSATPSTTSAKVTWSAVTTPGSV